MQGHRNPIDHPNPTEPCPKLVEYWQTRSARFHDFGGQETLTRDGVAGARHTNIAYAGSERVAEVSGQA